MNAIRYLVRSGCAWSMLPIHFPPWETVYGWFRRLMFRTIHDTAPMIDRALADRDDEVRVDMSETMIDFAMGGLMLRRITHP